MEMVNKNNLLFYITRDEMENEAQVRIGRPLSEEEIMIAKKGFEWGLLNGIDTIVNVIFEMIEEKENEKY